MPRIPSLGQRGEGWVVLQIVAAALVVVAPAVRQGSPSGSLATISQVVGSLLMLAGGAAVLWGYLALTRGRAFSVLPRPIAGGELVESGPYRWIRNPIYLGLVLGGLGLATARDSIPTLGATVLLFAILDLKRRREEAWLTEQFVGFRAYRARTKALIPFVY